MADHTKFLTLARRLIAKDGRQVTFSKLVTTSADGDRPWKGPTRDVGDPPPLTGGVTCFAVFLPDGAGFGTTFELESLFAECEKVLLVAPPSTGEDLTTYHVLVETELALPARWNIHMIKTLMPADLALLHAIGVKR